MDTDLQRRAAAVAAVPAAVALGALGAVRRARAFHPRGMALTGTWTAVDDLLDPLIPSRPWPVVVRLSKGVGLPGALPDVLGLAVRLVDLRGRDEHQDLLLSSASHRILRPTNDFGHVTYSSILPYETPAGRGELWARAQLAEGRGTPHSLDEAADAALAGDLTFVVGVDTPGRERLLAEIHLHERLDPDVAEGLRFDPLNARPDLRPTGAVQELREKAYRASQRFRPTPEGDAEATDEAVEQEATAAR
jgi:hypothetical protein